MAHSQWATTWPGAQISSVDSLWTGISYPQRRQFYYLAILVVFVPQFKLEESTSLNGGVVRLKLVGRVGFVVGENVSINCTASGFCRTWLDEQKGPQLMVPVAEVERLEGVCESF